MLHTDYSLFIYTNVALRVLSAILPAPLKLRPVGAIQICYYYYLLYVCMYVWL